MTLSTPPRCRTHPSHYQNRQQRYYHHHQQKNTSIRSSHSSDTSSAYSGSETMQSVPSSGPAQIPGKAIPGSMASASPAAAAGSGGMIPGGGPEVDLSGLMESVVDSDEDDDEDDEVGMVRGFLKGLQRLTC